TLLDSSVEPPAWIGGPRWPVPARELRVVRNGLLHLPTMTLYPHTPRLFTLNALDFDYDPKAPPPREWLRFLRKTWAGEPESIYALMEWFGYCLTHDTSQQKIMLLVGPKRSGMGTIARVQAAVAGAHNTCAPTLAGLGTNFGLAPLLGKTL